jgi:hypothetical protein
VCGNAGEKMISKESIFQMYCEAGNINMVKEMLKLGISTVKHKEWKYVTF